MVITSDSGSNKAGVLATIYEKTVDGLKQIAAKATAGFEGDHADSAPNLETSQRSASNALMFGHERLGAYARSAEIWAVGLQDLALQSATLARTSITEANEHLKKLSAAEFAPEAIETQTRIMRASADKAVAEASRLANAYVRLTEEAFAPITASVGMAAEPPRQGQVSSTGLQAHPAEHVY